MGWIYAVCVPKGGCGKTTTVHNLGMAWAEMGKRVLFVDTDPQGNLSTILGFRHRADRPTLYTAIKEFTLSLRVNLPRYTMSSGVDLVPTNMLLNRANDELAGVMNKEHVLARLLQSVRTKYDIIVIDSLPYLGVLVNNCLVAADEIIIPVQAEPLGVASAALLLQHMQNAYAMGLAKNLVIAGGLITMVDRRTGLNTQIAAFAREQLGPFIHFFTTEIERTIRFPESQYFRQPILTYSPKDKAAAAYRALAQELLSNEQQVQLKTLRVPEGLADHLLELAEGEHDQSRVQLVEQRDNN